MHVFPVSITSPPEVFPMRKLPALVVPTLVAAALSLTAGMATLPAQASSNDARTTPRLVDVRAAHHPEFDRVVFEFAGPLPAYDVEYVEKLVQDGSGRSMRIAGQAILQLHLTNAKAHTSKGKPTVRKRTAYALPNIITTVRAADFEGVVTYGIGLAKRSDVNVFSLRSPSRVVIDVDADFATEWRSVYFLDKDNYSAGSSPYVRAVVRPVLPITPATGVMDRLFAGPTPAERKDGLRGVRSHARGFTALSIADGIARVQLTGRCSSDGSTFTVADEILPTLRQFDNVDAVKVYDPSGNTGNPNGSRDSIPGCLQP
jgi:hypothetical protein